MDDNFSNDKKCTRKRRLLEMFVLVQEGINKNKMVNNLKHNVPKKGVLKTNLSQCGIRSTVAA